MIESKEQFLSTFMPEKVTQIQCAQINLDITDLSLADVLRNLNRAFPVNTRLRNAISSGTMIAAVLCKTETLDPLNGIFLILASEDIDFELISKNYIVLTVSESRINDDENIMILIDKITKYLVKNFKNSLADLTTFYTKFIYDPMEMEAENSAYRLPTNAEIYGSVESI